MDFDSQLILLMEEKFVGILYYTFLMLVLIM